MQTSDRTQTKAPIRCWNDLAYSADASDEQHAHLFVPEGEGPFPFVMCMHGGGWTSGTHHGYSRVAMPLAQAGFAAATVGYRKVDHQPWPTPLEDISAAFDFFQEHAAEFHIDSSRFAAMGDSAGGHLALMLSTKRPLQAVVSVSGPTDVRPPVVTSMTKPYLDIGTHPQYSIEEITPTASPVVCIEKDSCPILQILGGKDSIVPPGQPFSLQQCLDKLGVANELRMFPGEEHSLIFDQEEDVRKTMISFLKRRL